MEIIRTKSLLHLKNLNILTENSLEITDQKITCLKLENVIILQNVLFTIFLRLSRSLESIKLVNVNVCYLTGARRDSLPVYLPNLKSINAEYSDFEIFDFVAPKISEFRIIHRTMRIPHSLSLLLRESLDLKRLELHAVNCDLLEFFMLFKCCFKLKHLSLTSDTISTTMENERNFTKFVTQQVATITSLEIRMPLPDPALELLLKKCSNLRSLIIKTDFLPPNKSFYHIKSPRKRLKELCIEGTFANFEVLASIINLYPSVQKLTLKDYSSIVYLNLNFNRNLIKHIMHKYEQLRALYIPRMPHIWEGVVAFARLHELTIEYVNEVYEITNVLRNTPTLTALEIKFIFRCQSTEKFFKSLLSYNLSSLTVGAEPRESLRIHDIICIQKNSGGLRALKIKVLAKLEELFSFSFPMEKHEMSNFQTAERLADHVNDCEVEYLMPFLDELPLE